MNYTKPQVNTLGDATVVIESINPSKPKLTVFEATQQRQLPAYDLDE